MRCIRAGDKNFYLPAMVCSTERSWLRFVNEGMEAAPARTTALAFGTNVDRTHYVCTIVPVPVSVAKLPETFTYAQARSAGLSKHGLYRLRDEGRIEVLGRGVYRRSDATLADSQLLEIAKRAPRATLCLATALAKHGLSDEIPSAPDVALPRGTRTPATSAPVQWHLFDAATFAVGRQALPLDADTSIGLYSAERSIVDAFRTRGHHGHELAHDALKRWLRRPAAHPSALLKVAAHFPRSMTPIRKALEILL